MDTLICTGDSHFNERARLDECIRVHGWIADQVRQMRPLAFLHGGDVYDPLSGSSPVDRRAALEFFRQVADECPVVLTQGNHDAPVDLFPLTKIRARHPIHVIESTGIVALEGRDGSTIVVGGMAWPRRASAIDVEGSRIALANAIRELGIQMDAHEGATRIVLGHFMCVGAVTGAGQPLVGGGLSVTLADLALSRPHAVIMAHVHKPQEWTLDGVTYGYTGSPYKTDFGENEAKSMVAIDIDAGRVQWRRVATPARPMILIEGTYSADRGFAIEMPPSLESADVRFRYTVAAELRAAAKIAAKALEKVCLDAGAATVKIEDETLVVSHARAPEVAEAREVPDQLEAMWRARGDRPESPRAERLLARVGQLVEATP